MKAALEKLRRGERHWPAEAAFRAAGLAMMSACLSSWRLECRLTAEAPHQDATPLEFLAAVLFFACLAAALALTFEGPGLLRHVPLPPRASGHEETPSMNDLIWLGTCAGLFVLTFAFVRLCDRA